MSRTWEQEFTKAMEKWAKDFTERVEKVLRNMAEAIEEIDVKNTPICGATVSVGTMTCECGLPRFHAYPHDWDSTDDVTTKVRNIDLTTQPQCTVLGPSGEQCVLAQGHRGGHSAGEDRWPNYQGASPSPHQSPLDRKCQSTNRGEPCLRGKGHPGLHVYSNGAP